MKVWLSCFLVLFALAELYQWAQHLTLPLPIYILGGAFLAIASNANKRLGFFLPLKDEAMAIMNGINSQAIEQSTKKLD
ncbi:hypothetical protein [Aliterella atlantica]|uniref:Uncharacterized protein n=1 Tax=Aliterella atlantica CENA595 TaxID=1618023 RepID=A0A0D8ZUM3_9CYAN|nr:hypothetical protein [Aliterella atlantica]KJH72159.1 hypothetical protein UH38_08825 [Aliterella atlantica CENA595]